MIGFVSPFKIKMSFLSRQVDKGSGMLGGVTLHLGACWVPVPTRKEYSRSFIHEQQLCSE